MNGLQVEVCPETGMCSIVREGGAKVDLLPDEVDALRRAAGDAAKIREVLAGCDAGFADKLSAGEVAQIADRL
jgi:hypothetical protein